MSDSTELVLADPATLSLLVELERSGAITPVSLTLTDPDMRFESYEALGRFLGQVHRSNNWYLGDWLIFGEAVFGEDQAQAIEATTSERYDIAERVSGLDHGTLMNIRSVCSKVPKENRRAELGFWIHAEVAPLPPEEQAGWLQRAIDEGWNRQQLREAIKGGPPADEGAGDGGEHLGSIAERIEAAARLVFHQGTVEGSEARVPIEAWRQLAEALGEE